MTSADAGPSAVRVTRQGAITTVILHRPEVRNAVDRDTADALARAFREFDADPDASVAVLWGDGGTFCSGADLKAIAAGAPNRLSADGDGPMGPTRLQLSKPVIAAVSGFAVAGGLELALWCDLRVMEEDATMGVFCRRWGVPLIDGGTVRLPRVVGQGVALDLVLTGRPVGAEEALRIGLVSRVVPAGEALPAAQELAGQLAALPQTCLRSDRLALLQGTGLPEPAAIGLEWQRGSAVLGADVIAGANGFLATESGRG
ncbi:MAG: enoyl-CoA hydratase [Actinomycetota bacterium]|nr:enoyl-CoA hydratase [Actinomycetota bacterium]HQZ86090.1 crotonase/enoyl-CoA hydratase family protein [Actinomycetota bacterium]